MSPICYRYLNRRLSHLIIDWGREKGRGHYHSLPALVYHINCEALCGDDPIHRSICEPGYYGERMCALKSFISRIYCSDP
jgi:hypothetical protein